MALVPMTGFVGGSYRSASVNVATSELINWYVERTESDTDQAFPAALYGRPGITSFVSGLRAPIRGLFAQDGQAFAVGGDTVYELHGNGTATSLGTVLADSQPCTFASNGHGGDQLMITSGGLGYIVQLSTGTLTQIVDAAFPQNVVMCDFLDGYFIAMQATTSKFYLSALENGLSWDGTEVGSVSSSSDQLTALRVIQRNLWLFGSQRTEPWVNAGGTFPFQPIANVLIEYGIGAPWSLAECEGALVFVTSNEQGGAMVLQSNGYSFNRISTHSEERVLDSLPDLSNVRAFSYEERGHTHYVACPNTGPCLDYDFATKLWSTWGVWNVGADAYDPLRQWCHAYAWNRYHLVGDRTLGTIYVQSCEIGTDDGTPIRRVRTAPHLNDNHQFLFGSEVAIGLETGLATVADPNPVMELSYSRDGGHNYSAPVAKSLGAQGKFAHLPRWNGVPGKFADLVLKAVTTATIPVRINSCYLRLQPGTGMR